MKTRVIPENEPQRNAGEFLRMVRRKIVIRNSREHMEKAVACWFGWNW